MAFSPCDICLERKCLMPDGPGSCHCETCSKRDMCPRQLRPTIRITLKCTQACDHCCFECDTRSETHMVPQVAEDVARFVAANGVRRLNVMGGEFFCNPHWEAVLSVLAGSVGHLALRLVSNGDWAGNAKLRKRVVEFLKGHDSIYVALSNDRWHTNKHIATAASVLKKAGIIRFTATEEEGNSPPAPVGRHRFQMDSSFSMFACWCGGPEKKYHFLINEEGLISKCPLGIWTYDRIGPYLDGGFRERFKQFHGVFHSTFIANCHRCADQWEFAKGEMLKHARE